MGLLDSLLEAFLVESALTKGSQRVMNDKKLVPALADAVRDDAASNPSAFPAGSKRNFQNATDEAVAQWFLENIDRIEREGYEGNVYSRDGVNNDWIVRRYIAGSHSWEDLTGVMNMNLNDWYMLKNRNLLDANHKDLPKFNSVRDLGYYLTTHYKSQLEKVRDAAKNAARNKMSKYVKLVDNDDYRIYTTLNRAAGCALGLGTQWCTANSNYGGHFHSYSGRAMLFQLFPYEQVDGKTKKDEEGKKVSNENEKYQFDAGGPNFMDVTDRPVRPEYIREKFPYLFTDLSKGLMSNKDKMEKAFEELSNDPTLQHEDFKIKKYEIDEEIRKLHKFVDRGYMTDEARPSKTSHDAPAGEQPTIEPPQQQTPQEPRMESIKDLAKAMLEDVTIGHIVRQFKPVEQHGGEESPLTYGEENLDELAEVEGDEMQDDSLDAQLGGSMGSAGGATGGGSYAPGTAPTMPESINQGTYMENVDKDVAAMLASLKKYDTLKESVAPVLAAKPAVKEAEKKETTWTDSKGNKHPATQVKGDKYTGKEAEKDAKAKDKKDDLEEAAEKKETTWTDKSGKKHPATQVKGDKYTGKEAEKEAKKKEVDEGAKPDFLDVDKDGDKKESWKKAEKDKKEEIEEQADPEVISWMKRFNKLG